MLCKIAQATSCCGGQVSSGHLVATDTPNTQLLPISQTPVNLCGHTRTAREALRHAAGTVVEAISACLECLHVTAATLTCTDEPTHGQYINKPAILSA